MAQVTSLEGLRSQVQDSIKGRKLGLDGGGFLVGAPSPRVPVTAATSATTGTAIPSYGYVTIQSASAGTPFNLAAPVPGVQVHLISMSTGGAVITVPSGVSIISSVSSTGTFYTLTAASSYQQATLIGLSTSVFKQLGTLSTGWTVL